MSKSYRTFYINLDRDLARRHKLEAEATRVGISVERFPAFFGTNISDRLKPYFNQALNHISKGEIGCYASHLALCQMLVDDEKYDYYLILEDDVTLNDKVVSILDELIVRNPSGWDRVHLSATSKYTMLLCGNISDFKIVQYSKIPTNAAGYLISKKGAQKFLTPRLIRRALDHDYQRDWQYGFKTLGIHPKLITQRGGDSSIESIEKRRQSVLYKLTIDTPLDRIRQIYHLLMSIGYRSFLKITYLNLKIEVFKKVFKKFRVFIFDHNNNKVFSENRLSK